MNGQFGRHERRIATEPGVQHRTCEVSEAGRVIQFATDQEAGVGGDATATEFKLRPTVDSTVEIPPGVQLKPPP